MVGRMKTQFRNMSIKYKMVLLLYISILPFLLILIGYLYVTMQRSTSESLSTAYEEIARQTNKSIDFIQTDIEDISTYVCINENIKRVLNDGASSEELKKTWLNDSSMSFFMDIVGSKSYISFIALYANNGYEPSYITTDTSVLISDINEIVKKEYYKKASAAKGAPVWHRIDKNDQVLFEINKASKIIMNRVIINHMEVKNIGFLVVGMNADYLGKICTSMTEENEGIIVQQEEEILVEKGDVNHNVREYIQSDTIKADIGKAVTGVVKYEEYLIYYSKIGDNRSEVYYIVPKSFMTDKYSTARLVSYLLLVGVLLLMLPISFAVSSYFAKPLKRITDSMQKFKKGDFSQQVQSKSNDEIGEVAKCYNDMVKNIKELIDTKYLLEIKEKESELSALQAQINPHFLYNTLDSIYWKELVDGNKDTAEMVYSLSRIFRLSLNRGKGFTTVEKEIELVRHYLNIQKMRFEDKLEYTITLDESLNNYIIPKLVLQPFVENAIVHGIEQEGNGGCVGLIARREEDKMCFIISDSGKGMNTKQVEKLFEKSEGDVSVSKTPGGYAINNVYDRLKLKYKENFTLKIESKINEGTKVIIRLPYSEIMDEDE